MYIKYKYIKLKVCVNANIYVKLCRNIFIIATVFLNIHTQRFKKVKSFIFNMNSICESLVDLLAIGSFEASANDLGTNSENP